MGNDKINQDEQFQELVAKWKELTRNSAIISVAMQKKKSEEIIAGKLENEKNAITYGINSINKKILENIKKYTEVEQEFTDIMTQYEKNLIDLATYHDCLINVGYTKIVTEEIKQMEMNSKIYELTKIEKKAKTKADNSDDEIREQICDIEDEISKSELKIRRLKPTIKKKVEEKDYYLNAAMETKENQIQRNIKGPKVFSKATKFFLGKLKPYKMIEKDIFSKIKIRLEQFEREEKVKIRKSNEKYKEEHIIDTIDELFEKAKEDNE